MDNQTSQEMIAIAKQHNSEIMPKEIFSQIMSLLDLPTLSAWATTCSQFGVKQISIHIVNNCVRSYAQNDGKTFNTTGFVNLSREWIKRISRCSVKSQIPEKFNRTHSCYDSKVISRAFLLAVVSADIKKVRFLLNFCCFKINEMGFDEIRNGFDERIDRNIRIKIHEKFYDFRRWMSDAYGEENETAWRHRILNALLMIPLIFGIPKIIGVCFNWVIYVISGKPSNHCYALVRLHSNHFSLTSHEELIMGEYSDYEITKKTGDLTEYVDFYAPKFSERLALIKSAMFE